MMNHLNVNVNLKCHQISYSSVTPVPSVNTPNISSMYSNDTISTHNSHTVSKTNDNDNVSADKCDSESHGANRIVSEDDPFEQQLLRQAGYIKIKNISNTLQGSIFVAFNIYTKNEVVIKRASRILHENSVTIHNNGYYRIQEDIMKEKDIMQYLTFYGKKSPSALLKYIDFMESNSNYYLIMEHGGLDFFTFVQNVHKAIKEEKLNIDEWRKYSKDLTVQMVSFIKWLHESMNTVHLDISMENLTVQNGDFIINDDGTYNVNPKIQIKFCDYGLSERFSENNKSFTCNKFVGKLMYQAPEIYDKKQLFDARKADIWSLGVVIFNMSLGMPPYMSPSDECNFFKYYVKTGLLRELIFAYNKATYLSGNCLDLLNNMLNVDPDQRFLANDVAQHKWLA